MKVIFNGTSVTASAPGAGPVITISGYTVNTSDLGNNLDIASGSGFIQGSYTIIGTNVVSNLWILDRNCTSGVASGLTGVAQALAVIDNDDSTTQPPQPPFIPTPPPTLPPTVRTSAALVGGIIQVQDGIDVTPFIMMGNILTTEECSQSGYSDGFVNSQMELIERWLSAHFYAIFDQQLASAKAGSVSVTYQVKIDFGLKSTMYGQQAMLVDVMGNLAKLDNSTKIKRKIKVSAAWLGHRRYCGLPQGDPYWSDLSVSQ